MNQINLLFRRKTKVYSLRINNRAEQKVAYRILNEKKWKFHSLDFKAEQKNQISSRASTSSPPLPSHHSTFHRNKNGKSICEMSRAKKSFMFSVQRTCESEEDRFVFRGSLTLVSLSIYLSGLLFALVEGLNEFLVYF